MRTSGPPCWRSIGRVETAHRKLWLGSHNQTLGAPDLPDLKPRTNGRVDASPEIRIFLLSNVYTISSFNPMAMVVISKARLIQVLPLVMATWLPR